MSFKSDTYHFYFKINKTNKTTKCQEREEEKENHPHPDQYPELPELDFNSQSEELPDILNKEDTHQELELEPQSILLLFSNTSLLKFLSSPEMPPEITREAELFQDTFNLLLEMTRNLPD